MRPILVMTFILSAIAFAPTAANAAPQVFDWQCQPGYADTPANQKSGMCVEHPTPSPTPPPVCECMEYTPTPVSTPVSTPVPPMVTPTTTPTQSPTPSSTPPTVTVTSTPEATPVPVPPTATPPTIPPVIPSVPATPAPPNSLPGNITWDHFCRWDEQHQMYTVRPTQNLQDVLNHAGEGLDKAHLDKRTTSGVCEQPTPEASSTAVPASPPAVPQPQPVVEIVPVPQSQPVPTIPSIDTPVATVVPVPEDMPQPEDAPPISPPNLGDGSEADTLVD